MLNETHGITPFIPHKYWGTKKGEHSSNWWKYQPPCQGQYELINSTQGWYGIKTNTAFGRDGAAEKLISNSNKARCLRGTWGGRFGREMSFRTEDGGTQLDLSALEGLLGPSPPCEASQVYIKVQYLLCQLSKHWFIKESNHILGKQVWIIPLWTPIYLAKSTWAMPFAGL